MKFNIPFINGSYDTAINLLKNGAFMVVPAGPGLSTIESDKRYSHAVANSDFEIKRPSLLLRKVEDEILVEINLNFDPA